MAIYLCIDYPYQTYAIDTFNVLSVLSVLCFKTAVVYSFFKNPLTRFFKECFSKNDRVKKDLVYARSIYGNDRTELTES